MSPSRLSAAINVSLKADQYVFTRIFLMFRGISDDERDDFAVAGEKEAWNQNWRQVIEWQEASRDNKQFRVLEVSVLEVS